MDHRRPRRSARPLIAVVAVFAAASLLAACNASGSSLTERPRRRGTPGRQNRTPRRQHTTPPPGSATTPPQAGANSYGGVTLPASDFQQNTWGYVGCSNTHDTIWGYHNGGSDQHLFWPFTTDYHIEGRVVLDWADPGNRIWSLFDSMKQQYNGGQDPPVIWVQLCENIGLPGRETFGQATQADVDAELANLKQHAPTSIVFIGPLQTYDPPTLCGLMGSGGEAIPQLTGFSSSAVQHDGVKAGPGVDGNPPLGPLTASTAFTDGCHPSGGPHGPGTGATFLGGQLASFFDNIPQS